MASLTDLLSQMNSPGQMGAESEPASLLDVGRAFLRSRTEGGSVSGVLDKQRTQRLAEQSLARQEQRQGLSDALSVANYQIELAKAEATKGNAEAKAVFDAFQALTKDLAPEDAATVWAEADALPDEVGGNNAMSVFAGIIRNKGLTGKAKEPAPRQIGATREIQVGREKITQEWTGTGWQEVGRGALDAPDKPSDIMRRATEAGLVPGTPEYQQFIRDATLKPSTEVNVTNTGETEFAKQFAKKRAENLAEKHTAAQDAIASQNSIAEARALLDKGIVSGLAADVRVTFGKALQLAGFNYADEDIANTEAYVASSAQRTAQIIKAFGAGTGLSDADREYAAKAAAGKIELTEKSLRRILDINERANAYAVRRWNEEFAKLPADMQKQYDLGMPDPRVNPAPGASGGWSATEVD